MQTLASLNTHCAEMVGIMDAADKRLYKVNRALRSLLKTIEGNPEAKKAFESNVGGSLNDIKDFKKMVENGTEKDLRTAAAGLKTTAKRAQKATKDKRALSILKAIVAETSGMSQEITRDLKDSAFFDAQKYKTMGSAGSMEDLENLVKKKMYWSKLDLKQVSDKEWQVIKKGQPSDMRVIKKGNRYQLQYPIS